MTDKKGTPGKDQSKPGEKRPHATLDLKATEVRDKATSAKAEMGKSSAGATAAKSTPASETPGAKPAEKPAAPPAKPDATAKKPDAKSEANSGAKSIKDVAAKKSGGGFFSHMAAGIVGAALTLVGANTILPMTGHAPTAPSVNTSALEQRLAAIENAGPNTGNGAVGIPADLAEKLTAAEERFAAVDKISAELAAIKSQQSEMAEQAADLDKKVSSNAAPDSATGRLASLEQQLKTLSAAALTGDGDTASAVPQLAAITGRLADLERTLANQMTALRNGVAKDVEKRIATTAEASVAAQTGTERMDRELATVKTDTARFSQQLEVLKAGAKNVTDKLRVVQEETGSLRSDVNNLKDDLSAKIAKTAKPSDIQTAVTSVNSQIAALASKVDNVVATEGERAETAKRIVLSIELSKLKNALDRGQSYSAELASVREVAPASFELTTLDKYRKEGVATLPKLQSDFRSLAYKIIDAETAPVDGSIVDRFFASAKSVVRVRKVNHAADDASVEATVSRMGTALEDGDLEAVMREAKKLPAQSSAPAADWLDQVNALSQVNATLAKIDEQLKNALVGKTPDADPSTTPAKPE